MNRSKPIFYVFLGSIIGLATAAISFGITGFDHFEEGEVMTLYSTALLLIAALISFQIFQVRWATLANRHQGRIATLVWLAISAGLLFLAADELFEFHEKIDFAIHARLNIEETRVTDRLDDVLVGVYGLVSLWLLFTFRKEISAFKQAIPYFKWAFILLFVMVILDSIVNGNDIFPLFFEEELAWEIKLWVEVTEDSLKIISETFFIGAFFEIFDAAQIKKRATTLKS